jgi:large subunit ribosomal protein L25
MKTLEIIGYKRANLGKSVSKQLREEGNVPSVLYGGDEQVHFYVPMIQFRELVYSPDVYFVNLNIEGVEFKAILQDVQFHPVSEIILHADFLQLFDEKPLKMDVPVKLVGVSPGVINGGTLVHKRRTIQVKALPKNIPDAIEVDISALDFHKAVKVEIVEEKDFEILDPGQASIAVVEVPRALRAALLEEEEAALLEEELAIAAEGETPEDSEGGKDAPSAPEQEGDSEESNQ